MKIGFFSNKVYSTRLGATKNRIELAAALEGLGWETALIQHTDLDLPDSYKANRHHLEAYAEALKNHLIDHASEYDVVLYEYDTLPFPRETFAPETLFVARPALLFYHFQSIRYPRTLKSSIRNAIHSCLSERQKRRLDHRLAERSMREADLIQVQNERDITALEEKGFPRSKIIKVPNGISAERLADFQSISRIHPKEDKIAFVGTFDFRKGACDFPKIVGRILEAAPSCRFKLLGTDGMLSGAEQVIDFFPATQRHALEVIPKYAPEELPQLLADCKLGIFPSYIESFGFGALEMMAAGLPVVAYEAPGPSDYVPAPLLVGVGDSKAMAEMAISLLKDGALLKERSGEAAVVADRHRWDLIAKSASELYRAAHARLGSGEREVL